MERAIALDHHLCDSQAATKRDKPGLWPGWVLDSYSLLSLLQIIMAMAVAVVGSFVASLVQQVRWPVFRAQIHMATDNRVNIHIFIEETLMYLSGLVFLFAPQAYIYSPEVSVVANHYWPRERTDSSL